MAHHNSPGEHVTVEATKQPVGIWSGEHRFWWRANRGGYTRDPAAIGLYTMQEAMDATRHCGPEKQICIRDLPAIVGQSPTPVDLQEIMRRNNELLATCKALIEPWNGYSDQELLRRAAMGGVYLAADDYLPADDILAARKVIARAGGAA